MDSNYSKNLENEDNAIIQTDRRLIISNAPEKEEKETNEEEEFWDYDDGGQTMEELERLEKLELIIQPVINIYSRFKNTQELSLLFDKWKNLPNEILNQRKVENIIINTQSFIVKDTPNESNELHFEQILPNNPIIKEINYPFIIKELKYEDNSELKKNKPKKKFEKINTITDLILSKGNIDLSNPEYFLDKNQLNIYKNLIPNLISTKPELSPIKIKRKPKIIEIEQSSEENNYNIINCNKPIRRDNKKELIKTFQKDEIKNDKSYISNKIKEKINEREIDLLSKERNDKYNLNETMNEIKDSEIQKDYYSKIFDDISKRNKDEIKEKLNIINLDYQIYLPKGKKQKLDIKNSIENLNIINDNTQKILEKEEEKQLIKNNFNIIDKKLNYPDIICPNLKQRPEKTYKIIKIPPEVNDKIKFGHIVPNNPISKNVYPPFVHIDINNNNSDEINKKPKKRFDKVNIVDKINASDNLDLINNDYYYKDNINNVKKINIIPQINLFLPNLKPIEIELPVKKYFNLEKVKDKREFNIQTNYIVRSYPTYKKAITSLDIIKNDYQIILSKYFNINKIQGNINSIENENIIKNEIILTEESNLINTNKLNNNLNLPKEVNKLSLFQKPEKLKLSKKIDVSNETDEISIEQIKLNKSYKRDKLEKSNITMDNIFKDIDYIKDKNKKILNKININDKIQLADNFEQINTQYQINNKKQKINNLIPKIIKKEYPTLNPFQLSLELKLKKYNSFEQPNEIKNIEIKNDYQNIKYIYKNAKDNLPLLLNKYQLSEINAKKIRLNNKNSIDNEKIKNNNILNLENELIYIKNKNNINLPEKIGKYNLNQIPEKIKEFNKSNLTDKINISKDDMKLLKTNFSIGNDKNKINIPQINIFSPSLNTIEIELPFKKYLNHEQEKEQKIIKMKTNYILRKYPVFKEKLKPLKIINNDYLLFLPKFINKIETINRIIENEDIIKNNISLNEEQTQKKTDKSNNLFCLPKGNKLFLTQKPEKAKVPKIVNIPNSSDEIIAEPIKLNKPLKKEKLENQNIMKDNMFEDADYYKKKQKKIIEKININDKAQMYDDIELFNSQYDLKDKNKSNNNLIPKIILNEQLELKSIQPFIKLHFEKQIILEKPKETKNINIKKHYLNIQNYYIEKNNIKNLPLLTGNYQLSQINIDKYRQTYKNTIDNENIIDNKDKTKKDLITPFLKEVDILNKNPIKNRFSFPNNIKLNLIQKPELLRRAKNINIPNISDEINIAQIKPNKTIIRDLNMENITKDKILEDLEDMKKKHKKQINKININDKISITDNAIDTLNTNYENKIMDYKGNKFIPDIISSKQELNPIQLSLKLNIEKLTSIENQKEIKEIKIKCDFLNRNIDYKYFKRDDKLSLLNNNYQLSEYNPLVDSMNNKNNILRAKKSFSKEIINYIENENIKINNNFKEEIIPIKLKIDKPQFNFNSITNKTLFQKPERIPKIIKIKDETEEISSKVININNPIIKGTNKLFIKKDELETDKDLLNKNIPKKLLIKTNINDDIKLSENLELQNTEYNLKENKSKLNIILNEYTELNPIKQIRIEKHEKNENNILNKNLAEDFEKEEQNKSKNQNSTVFKFYDSKNKELATFNSSSFSQDSQNSVAQKQFFNFMHKKFVAFKLFNLKNSYDPKRKWFKIWKKNIKE